MIAFVTTMLFIVAILLYYRLLDWHSKPRKTIYVDAYGRHYDTNPTEQLYDFVFVSEGSYYDKYFILHHGEPISIWSFYTEKKQLPRIGVVTCSTSDFYSIYKYVGGQKIKRSLFYKEYEAFILEHAKEAIRQYDRDNNLIFFNEV